MCRILLFISAVLFSLSLQAEDVFVSNSVELQNAINSASPGQVIYIADGIYTRSGGFYVSAGIHGTPTKKIHLVGTSKAIISSDNLSSGYGFALKGNNYWILDGFTVYNSKKGIVIDNSYHNEINNITVNKIGDEGIHVRTYSSYNSISNCFVDSCGIISTGTGEGIYIGSANSNWSKYTNGNPDTCNYNTIIYCSFGNHISSENIDIKEGTKGGLISFNTFNGSGLNNQNSADSWIDVKGNYYQIECNTGANTLLNGFETHINYAGYGNHNTFSENELSVESDGYGIKIQTTGSKGTANDNKVCSSNTINENSRGISNISSEVCENTCLTVGLGQVNQDYSVKVYPNPSNGQFIIEHQEEIEHVQIFDLQGRLIHSNNPYTKNYDVQLEKIGVYFLSVQSKSSDNSQKVIVLR